MSVKTRKTIVIVGPVPPPYGGIATYVSNLLQSRLNQSFNLSLHSTIVPPHIRSFDATLEKGYLAQLRNGVIPFVLMVLYILKRYLDFVRKIQSLNPCLVHIHTSSGLGFLRSVGYIILSKWTGVDSILHLHNAIDLYYAESGALGCRFIRLSLRIPQRLVVLSNGIRQKVRYEILRHDTPISVIRNGVDEDFVKALLEKKRESNPNKNGTLHVLTLGRLGRNKGTYDILEAAKRLKEWGAPVRLTLAGHGDTVRFQHLVCENELEDYVELPGPISEEEKVERMKKSHVFLLPSYWEGQPVSILEAMSASLPVVASYVGSIPEIIKQGVNGFLIKPGDTGALVAALMNFVKDRELVHRMGEANRRLALSEFCQDRVIRDVEDLYAHMIR